MDLAIGRQSENEGKGFGKCPFVESFWCFCFFTACSSKAAKAVEKVELGQKYLTELNYTEAVAPFTEAIGLDPGEYSGIYGTCTGICRPEAVRRCKGGLHHSHRKNGRTALYAGRSLRWTC